MNEQSHSQSTHWNKYAMGVVGVFIAGILFIFLATALYILGLKISTPQHTACTLEAKLCPDGSAVGRTGPNCEFAACPSAEEQTFGWKTYVNNDLGFSIKYPDQIHEYYFPGPSGGSNIQIALPNIKGDKYADDEENIQIMWYTNKDLTPEKLIDIHLQQQSDKPDIKYEKSKYILGDKEMEMLIMKTTQDYEVRRIYVPTTKTILEVLILYQNKNKETTLKQFDQILSTFKFTQ